VERRGQATYVEIESGSTGNRRNPLVSAEGGSLQGSYEPDKSKGLRPVL